MMEEFVEEKSTKYITDSVNKLNATLKKIIKGFLSSPFLFIGSGFSRRYMQTPSWKELLTHFAGIIRDDDPNIAFRYYESISTPQKQEDKLPCIASHLKADFNIKWLGDKNFRERNPLANTDSDPFNSAVAQYINTFAWDKITLKNEIDSFKNACGSSIAGIITTNYDNLLEKLSGFVSYIGQSELLVSDPQGLAEIYKIHGSISKPDSLILTKEDYDLFRSKAQYLSAKLITIFMEHPIFFIGYSLQDPDILDLIKTLIGCFDVNDKDKIQKFQDRLFFVSYEPESIPRISDYALKYDGSNLLSMKKISVTDFDIIFKAFKYHQLKISVKTMRALKESFVEYALTNKPNSVIQASDIENKALNGEEVAIYFGLKKDIISAQGLIGKNPNDLFKDIIYDDFGYSADDILSIFLPEVTSHRPGYLPVFKYIANSKKEYQSLNSKIRIARQYNDLLNTSIIRKQTNDPESRSISVIISTEELKLAVQHIQNIKEEDMDKTELRNALTYILDKHPNIFSKDAKTGIDPSIVRKLILLLDYLENKERAMMKLKPIVEATS